MIMLDMLRFLSLVVRNSAQTMVFWKQRRTNSYMGPITLGPSLYVVAAFPRISVDYASDDCLGDNSLQVL
jgi:hypothetical protein